MYTRVQMRSGVVSTDLFCVHKSTYWNVERTQGVH